MRSVVRQQGMLVPPSRCCLERHIHSPPKNRWPTHPFMRLSKSFVDYMQEINAKRASTVLFFIWQGYKPVSGSTPLGRGSHHIKEGRQFPASPMQNFKYGWVDYLANSINAKRGPSIWTRQCTIVRLRYFSQKIPIPRCEGWAWGRKKQKALTKINLVY